MKRVVSVIPVYHLLTLEAARHSLRDVAIVDVVIESSSDHIFCTDQKEIGWYRKSLCKVTMSN